MRGAYLTTGTSALRLSGEVEMMQERKTAARRPPLQALVSDVFVAFVLDALAESSAEQRTCQRVTMIDQRAGRGADERATGLAVVFAVICRVRMASMVNGSRECCVGRNEQGQTEHRSRNFH
jgi:hypothetical protein